MEQGKNASHGQRGLCLVCKYALRFKSRALEVHERAKPTGLTMLSMAST